MSMNDFMINNGIFFIILKRYLTHLDNLYEDESACLLTFRVLSPEHQHIIMRTMDFINDFEMTKEDFKRKFDWWDIFEPNDIDEKLNLFFGVIIQIKIFNMENNIIRINENFRNNLKNVITNGIRINDKFILATKEKSEKSWDKLYLEGMTILKKYLFGIKDLDFYNEENLGNMNEKIKFLVESNFLKKSADSEGRLTAFALNFLLEDLQTQLRKLVIRFMITYLHEGIKDKDFEFLLNLFKLCTVKIGEVIFWIFS